MLTMEQNRRSVVMQRKLLFPLMIRRAPKEYAGLILNLSYLLMRKGVVWFGFKLGLFTDEEGSAILMTKLWLGIST